MSYQRRRRQQDDFAEVVDDLPDLKHSGLGITSCIVAGVCCAGHLLSVGLLWWFDGLGDVLLGPTGAWDLQENQLSCFAFFAVGFLNLIGFALGYLGILRSDRKVAYSVLGMILNAFSLPFAIILLLSAFISIEPILRDQESQSFRTLESEFELPQTLSALSRNMALQPFPEECRPFVDREQSTFPVWVPVSTITCRSATIRPTT